MRWITELLAHESPRSLDGLEADLLDSAAKRRPATGVDSSVSAELLDRVGGVARAVLELRMGFATGTPLGYAEVARRLQLSASRVRRLEAAALDTLRDVCPYDALEGYG